MSTRQRKKEHKPDKSKGVYRQYFQTFPANRSHFCVNHQTCSFSESWQITFITPNLASDVANDFFQ